MKTLKEGVKNIANSKVVTDGQPLRNFKTDRNCGVLKTCYPNCFSKLILICCLWRLIPCLGIIFLGKEAVILSFTRNFFVNVNRPFPHSCKQRYPLEAQVDKIQWFVWNRPPEPRPHFFMFAHWSVMRGRSISLAYKKTWSAVSTKWTKQPWTGEAIENWQSCKTTLPLQNRKTAPSYRCLCLV